MNKLKHFYTKEDGASSVLVMVMMIVLIAFGLAGFSLALSNERLANKKIAWLSEYYAVESNANLMLGEIYQAIDSNDIESALLAIETEQFKCINFESEKNTDNYDYLISYTITNNEKTAKYIDVKLGVILGNNKKVDVLSFKQRQDELEIIGF